MQKNIDSLLQPAKIPNHLGKCETLKIHDDGDITTKCGDEKFVVTTEGEVFKEIGISYYGSLVGGVFQRYLRKEITLDQFLKEAKEIEKMFRGAK